MNVKTPPYGINNSENTTDGPVEALADRLRAQYGEVLDQRQLADVLGRSAGGVRVILSSPYRREAVSQLAWLCSKRRRAGRRAYYLISDVAKAVYFGDAVTQITGDDR